MAFMTNTASGGEFTPYVKYNAKAGRWYTKKDEPDAEEFEVQNMTAIFDMDNLQTGWFLFASGVAPVKHMDPSLAEAAPSPGDGFKRGFQLDVFSEKNLLGKRELSSTAGAVIEAMNDLHDDWLANQGANAGKLPVVKCTGVQPITNKHGTNYRPVLEIVGWADRPAEMQGTAKPAPAPTPAAKPAPAAAQHAPPPAQAATADSEAVEF
jgi:type II secretory pathway component HofQ